MSSRDGRMAPSNSSKKDLGVVTPLVSAGTIMGFFLSPSLRMRHPFSCQGLLGVSAFLYLILI